MKNQPSLSFGRSLLGTLVILPFLAIRPIFAASGTEAAAFLDIPVGAAPAAMGAAYTAFARDAYAPVWNAAGLGELPRTQFAAQHLSFLESTHYQYVGFVHPIRKGKAIGISAQYFGTGDIAGTDPNGASIGDYSSYYGAYSVAYGQRLTGKASIGMTGKWINAKLSEVSANAYALDFGALYQMRQDVDVAFTLTNVGTPLAFTDQKDALPLAFHAALAYQPRSPFKMALEAVYSKTGLASLRTGAEWIPMKILALRAGYRTDTLKELSPLAGFSTGFGVRMWGQELAYAWVPYGDLGDTHYVSLVMHWGQVEDDRKNLIQYQRIRKHRSVEKGRSRDSMEESPEYQQLMQLLSDSDREREAKSQKKSGIER